MSAVTLARAARELGKSESTLRAWVRRGAPTARPGEAGRGRGALVVVQDLERWRAKQAAQPLENGLSLDDLRRYLEDYHRGADHRLAGLYDEPARLLYRALYEYVAGRLKTAQAK